MGTAPTALTTALAAYLKKDAASADAGELDRLATAAIAMVERETGWALSKAEATETHDGDGGTILFLDRAPLVSITSLTIDGVAIPSSTGVTVPGYIPYHNSIRLRGYTFTEGMQNVVAVVTAGYESIPTDFLQQLVAMAAYWFVRKNSIGQSSTQFDRETTSFQASELSDGLKAWLASARRRVF